MISIGIFEAKANLGQLVKAAALGERVVLTRRGKPIAELSPPRNEDGEVDAGAVLSTIAALRAARRDIKPGDATISELVAEGRR